MSLVLLPNCVVKKLPLTFVELPTVRCVGSSLSGRIVSAISATVGAVSVCMGIITPIEGMSIGHTMLVIAGSLLILKGLDDFVLQPTLYSERVKAQPLEIFLVILIAGSLAGVIGMLLAIPLYTVLRVFAKEFFSQISLVRKLTEKI